MPTDAERNNLSRLLHLASVGFGALILGGQPQRAKDRSEAFRNVPLLLRTGHFSFKAVRDFLVRHRQQYAKKIRAHYLPARGKSNAATQ